MNKHFDLIIVGAGSSGISAALAASRMGVQTLLIERNRLLGGTATHSGVNVWGQGVGGTGIPHEIYERMKAHENAIGITRCNRHLTLGRQFTTDELTKLDYPGVEHVIDNDLGYLDTLRRHPGSDREATEDFIKQHWHGLIFEPSAFDRVVTEMLAESGNCTVIREQAFIEVEAEKGGNMLAIQLEDERVFTARYWIDATDGRLCIANECKYLRGREPKARFNEPHAPEQVADDSGINAVTLIFRITPRDTARVDPLPDDIPAECWWAEHFPPMTTYEYPNDDRNCDMLPTMEGTEYMRMAPALAYHECHRRVKCYWHFLQTSFPEFQKHSINWYAAGLGVRETQRIITQSILTENDILAGLSGQDTADIIAIADHALDDHGDTSAGRELSQPYGVPYGCLVPKGFRNMLIASRSSGFSSIAAGSCRLGRTMMQLGQAAGTAVAIAKQKDIDLPAVPPDELQDALRQQNVQLDWPMSDALKQRLLAEA